MVNDFQEAQYKAAFKKAYSTFSQAHLMVVAENGGDIANTDVVGSRFNLRNAHLKYVKYTKKCHGPREVNVHGNCWHNPSSWKYFNGDLAPEDKDQPSYSAVLNNGMLIGYGNGSKECGNLDRICAVMFVDVNGFKQPNTVGKDIFGINFRATSTAPHTKDKTINDCNTTSRGWACSYKVIANEDY